MKLNKTNNITHTLSVKASADERQFPERERGIQTVRKGLINNAKVSEEHFS